MEESNELKEQSGNQTVSLKEATTRAPSSNSGKRTVVSQQAEGGECPTCGNTTASIPPSYVYVLGRVEPRFPRLSVEKEFAQATGKADTSGLTDRAALHKVLSQREYRYLARQLCYVLSIEGLDTYILVPRDPADLDLLVQALRPAPRPTDVDVVIGVRGPIASPEMCNGLMVPVVICNQIYSFDIDSLIQSIPKPEKMTKKEFDPAAQELLMRIIQTADNAGATDEHRALNYLAVRYPAIYATAAEAFGRNSSLTAVDARPSSLSGIRKLVEVIFSFTKPPDRCY
jgi:hypothetical protein